MVMANPQPPPQTSIHENGGGRRTIVGERRGVLCCKAPGRYPHMYATLCVASFSSIFTSPSPFMASLENGKKWPKKSSKKGESEILSESFWFFGFNVFNGIVGDFLFGS
ncbi:hypothetical protein L484_019772 [Morus notabilis]|uniref:Uncharacterized protein n=1 Tax=Morus notabilis TaxID=981085 RepID=W9QZD3_9ROSA|nr:hypothetical protein L484_019772 [Morus notabilis]